MALRTTELNFIFKGGTERSFRASDSFLNLTANARYCANGSTLESRHFEGGREHSFDERRFAVNLERCANQLQLFHYLRRLVKVEDRSGGCYSESSLFRRSAFLLLLNSI